VKATPGAIPTSTILRVILHTHPVNQTKPFLDSNQSAKQISRTKVKPNPSAASPAFQKKPDSLSRHGNRLFLQNMPSEILLLYRGHRTFHCNHSHHRSLPSSRSPQSPQPNRLQYQHNKPQLNRKLHSRRWNTGVHSSQQQRTSCAPGRSPGQDQPKHTKKQRTWTKNFEIAQSNQSDTSFGSSNRNVRPKPARTRIPDFRICHW